jgi:hypothetical protein
VQSADDENTGSRYPSDARAAEPLPQPKPLGPGGSCPHGYLASGSFCVPSQGAQDAVPKPPNGSCPWGWLASGSYCLRAGNVRRASFARLEVAGFSSIYLSDHDGRANHIGRALLSSAASGTLGRLLDDQLRPMAGRGRPARSRIINSKQPAATAAKGRANIRASVVGTIWPN